MYGSTAARTRERKEAHPELYCSNPKCLWFTAKGNVCQNHPVKYELPATATDRAAVTKGTDGRDWMLVDWQVVYGDAKPTGRMTNENYVPVGEVLNDWLMKEYGPFGTSEFPGRVVSHPRKK